MDVLRKLSLLVLIGLFGVLLKAADIQFNVNMSVQIKKGKFNPQSEFVDVAGPFNNWGQTIDTLLDSDGDSIYTVTLKNVTLGSTIPYKFRINALWNGREEFPNGGGNRTLTVTTQNTVILVFYNDDDGIILSIDRNKTFWWNNAIFYEVFVRSFYDANGDGRGDLKGLIAKLDYLNDGDSTTHSDLGITGLWLMPINPSPSYHGYDVTDYYGVNPQYGSMADFKELLTEAHKRGIKVIVDFVMNHTGNTHPWFVKSNNNVSPYRDFYRWNSNNPSVKGPWGQDVWHAGKSGYYYGVFYNGMPDLNYENPDVKDSLFNCAKYWLQTIGVDGFRLDAVKFIFEEGSALEDSPKTFDFWNEFNTAIKSVSPDAFAVGEAWTSTATVKKYQTKERLDYCFEFDLASNMLNAANNGNAVPLRNHLNTIYEGFPHLQWGSFLTNHDQNRVMDVLGGNIAKAKVAASLLLTIPGIPYLYYGEEIGMYGQKPDEDIRLPMQWNNAKNAGFSSGNAWRAPHKSYTQYNVAAEDLDDSSLLNHYRKFISLRNQIPALRTGQYANIPAENSAVMSFARFQNKDTVFVISNTSSVEQKAVVFDFGGWQTANKSIKLYNVLRNSLVSLNLNGLAQAAISLQPFETLILKADTLKRVGGDKKLIQNPDWIFQIFPNPTSRFVHLVLQKSPNLKGAKCVFYSATGQIKMEVELLDKLKQEIDLSRLETGVYMVVIESEQGRFVKKLMIEP